MRLALLRRPFVALLLNLASASGQSRTIRGMVVDRAGQPLAGVSIEGLGSGPAVLRSQTSADGSFTLHTDQPAAVFRHPGYFSARVRLNRVPRRIVLRASPRRSLPACPANANCTHNGTVESALCVPVVEGIAIEPPRVGVDSVSRDFIARGKRVALLTLETGWAGSSVPPPDGSPYWTSRRFSESVLEIHAISAILARQRAIDARGRASDGTYWRTLSAKPEAMSYQGVDVRTARLFDRLFDGLCERPTTLP